MNWGVLIDPYKYIKGWTGEKDIQTQRTMLAQELMCTESFISISSSGAAF